MRSELMEKLEKALEFDAAKTMTQWNDIYSRIPDRTVYSTKYAIIELAQKQSESLKPIHEKLLECVRALEKIDEDFGTDYADGNVMIAHAALEVLAKEVEK